MHAPIPGKSNTRFQNESFVRDACHTDDGKWAQIASQRRASAQKVQSLEVQALDREALRLKNEAALIEAKARILEFEQAEESFAEAAEGARDELRHLEALLAEIEPKRKYADLSDIEAAEATQLDEWAEDLKFTAECMIFGTRIGIAHDYFKVMRNHPRFHSDILPHLAAIVRAIETAHGQISSVMPKALEGPKA
jgi:DNA-binding transcriptional regulator PaaX